MASKNTATLKSDIDNNVNTNGTNGITGAVLNEVLDDIADSMLNENDADATSLNTRSTYVQPAYAGALPEADETVEASIGKLAAGLNAVIGTSDTLPAAASAVLYRVVGSVGSDGLYYSDGSNWIQVV